MQGVVAKIFEKNFGDSTAYSFTLRGDRAFYRLGNKRPTFSEGDSVQFDTTAKGQNIYAQGVRPWKEGGVSTAQPVAGVARVAGGPRNSDEFWANKEKRDIDTQKRIELQSCRNSAIELVRLLLSTGVEAVKLPAAQAKRESIVSEMVEKYTLAFLEENKSGGPKPEETLDPKVAEEAAPKAQVPDPDPTNGSDADLDWN